MISDQVLQVEKLIWRGRGLSRLKSGKIVLIDPGVYPGERVRVRISKEKKDYLQAAWTDIVDPLPERRPHPCPAADSCGGCRFGTLPNRIQLHFKHTLFLKELERALRPFSCTLTDLPLEILAGPKAWRYRWRGQVHVRNGRPHFMRMGSRDVVPFQDCLLLARPLGTGLSKACQTLPDGKHTLACSPRDARVASAGEAVRLELPLSGHDFSLKVDPGVFFQANWLLNQDLVQYVTGALSGLDRVADCYAGAGNFALPLCTVTQKVLALESNPEAVACCRESAQQAGLDNCEVQRIDLAGRQIGAVLERFGPQGLVLDPPRTGGGKQGLLALSRLAGLERMVWVSCDLVNACRDLRPFFEQNWRIRALALFDMFPQTWHLEAVFVLERGAGKGKR